MGMGSLATQRCAPCKGGALPLQEEEIQKYLSRLDAGWEMWEEKRLKRIFTFHAFREAIDFVVRVADIAEKEKHYPEIHIRGSEVTLELTSANVHGLSELDFGFASQLDTLYNWKEIVERFVFTKLFSLKVLVVLILLLLFMLLWKRYFSF